MVLGQAEKVSFDRADVRGGGPAPALGTEALAEFVVLDSGEQHLEDERLERLGGDGDRLSVRAAGAPAMIAAARRTVVLADHTKIGNDCFARFGDLDAVDTFITDTGAEAELVDEISEAGPRVVLA